MFPLRHVVSHQKISTLQQIRLAHSVLHFTPRTHCQEQEHQACYLTKTLVQHELPASHVHLPQEEREHIHEAVHQCIVNTNHFHQEDLPVLKKRWRVSEKEQAMKMWRHGNQRQLLLNLLRAVESVPSAAKIGPRNMTFGTDLVAPWTRLGTKVQVSGRHGHLISGKKMLPLFAGEDEIAATCDVDMSWNDVISPFFDLHPTRSNFSAVNGFLPGSKYPYPQMLIVKNPFGWKTRFNTGQGIFFAFAHAVNTALSRGEQMGTDLMQPVPMQFVSFDGLNFHFVCYQLNTLDFDSDTSGRKNMAWVLSEQELYRKVTVETALLDNIQDGVPALPSLPWDEDTTEFHSKRVSLWDYDRKVLSKSFSNDKCTRVCVNGYNRNTVDVLTDFLFRPCSSMEAVEQVEGTDGGEGGEDPVYVTA